MITHLRKLHGPILGITVLLGIWIVAGAASKTEKTSRPIDFVLKNLEGQEVRLQDYRGKMVLVNIWATWCGPCRAEIPDLVRIRNKYQDKGFEILGIVVSSRPENVRDMVKKLKINYPILWGTEKALAPFGKINAIPRTFLLDRKGYIVEDILGSRDFQFFDDLLKKYFPVKTE